MIKPTDSTSGALEFRCGACSTVFRHAVRIYNEAPTLDESQEYDVRHWSVADIDVQCPKCFAERTYRLELRPDRSQGVM
jgi:phage FluMu protein Com